VLAKVGVVQPHSRPVRHGAEGEQARAGKGRLEGLAVPGHTLIVLEAQFRLPDAGDGHLQDPLVREGRHAGILLLHFGVGIGQELPPPVQNQLGPGWGAVV